jgi:hypothetical protein
LDQKQIIVINRFMTNRRMESAGWKRLKHRDLHRHFRVGEFTTLPNLDGILLAVSSMFKIYNIRRENSNMTGGRQKGAAATAAAARW